MSSKYPFSALGPMVLLEMDEVEETTKSGFYIHSNTSDTKAEEKFQSIGTVREIGPLAYKYSDGFHPWVKVGDRVSIGRYEGSFHPDEVSGKNYRVVLDKMCTVKVNTIRGV